MTEHDPSDPSSTVPSDVIPSWSRVIALAGSDRVVQYRLYFEGPFDIPAIEPRTLKFFWEMRGGAGQARGVLNLTGGAIRALASMTPTQRWIILEEALHRKYMTSAEGTFPPSGIITLTVRDIEPPRGRKKA